MEDFADVARARASYKLYADALAKGREILLRAGIADNAPPIPEFDAVFRRLKSDARDELFEQLREVPELNALDAMRIWKSTITSSFGPTRLIKGPTNMRTPALIAISLAATLTLAAQQTKTFASAADVQALAEKAKQTRKANQPLVSQPILQLAPYTASLESRNAVAGAAIHEKEAEMFYVIEGSGTLVTGGKLVNETRNGDNLSGTAIEGGNAREVKKGDFVMVPENTAHWFSKIDGTLQLMSLHLPQAPAK